jgi:coronin-1B/1C/6
MASLVRASKFRHVYCDAPRIDATFQNFRLSTTTGEQSYIKANEKYFAISTQGGGGPVAIIPIDKPGRAPAVLPVIAGHAGPVLDFEFHPFDENLIATASEDSTIKLWQIPEGGLKENVTTPLIDLTNHTRKVTLLRFHPTANNVILSSSADQTVKLWDIEKGIEVNSNNDVSDGAHLIQDIVWDYHGNNYAISSKDKAIRIVDGRTSKNKTKI